MYNRELEQTEWNTAGLHVKGNAGSRRDLPASSPLPVLQPMDVLAVYTQEYLVNNNKWLILQLPGSRLHKDHPDLAACPRPSLGNLLPSLTLSNSQTKHAPPVFTDNSPPSPVPLLRTANPRLLPAIGSAQPELAQSGQSGILHKANFGSSSAGISMTAK